MKEPTAEEMVAAWKSAAQEAWSQVAGLKAELAFVYARLNAPPPPPLPPA